jgi:hypothetical protein
MLCNAIRRLKGAFVLVRMAHCHLPARCNPLFESQELSTNALPEGATSPADPPCSQEAWLRLKTCFVWGSSIQPRVVMRLVIASETCSPPKEDLCSPHRQFQPSKPIGHRSFAILGSFDAVGHLRSVKRKALKASSFDGGSLLVEWWPPPEKASHSPHRPFRAQIPASDRFLII